MEHQTELLNVPLPEGLNFAGRRWMGGHGYAFLVFHEHAEQLLVLKRLRTFADDIKLALISEADLMRALHEAAPRYFLRVVECRTDDSHGPWLLMEYAEGGSLRERLDEVRTLPFKQMYVLACQTARALDAAHAIGIVHRDAKPGNILYRADGSVVFGDLGIAHRLLENDEPPQPYTRKYVSPELVSVKRALEAGRIPPDDLLGDEVQKANDRYALATTLYETLAGTTPFGNDSDGRIGRRPPNPQVFNSAIGDQTAATLMRGVAAEFHDRPSSAWALAVDLGLAMVADGLLSHDQMLDAQASAPAPSAGDIADAREATRGPRRTVSEHDALVRPSGPTNRPGRTAHRLNVGAAVMAVIAVIALIVMSVWDDAVGGARDALGNAQDAVAWVDVAYVAWPLLGLAWLALSCAVVLRRSPRLFLGLLAVGLAVLGLQADTQVAPESTTLGVGMASLWPFPEPEVVPEAKPKPAPQGEGKLTSRGTGERGRAANSKTPSDNDRRPSNKSRPEGSAGPNARSAGAGGGGAEAIPFIPKDEGGPCGCSSGGVAEGADDGEGPADSPDADDFGSADDDLAGQEEDFGSGEGELGGGTGDADLGDGSESLETEPLDDGDLSDQAGIGEEEEENAW